MQNRSNPTAEKIRSRLDHPVIDSDGHLVEYLPLVQDFVRELAGPEVEAGFTRNVDRMLGWKKMTPEQRRDLGFVRPAFWALPSQNTLDRATAMLPRLLHQRLDELGIDFAVLYPTYGLIPANLANDEVRRAGCRAFNRYCAELYGEFSARLAPVAAIPMHTPEEAVEELEYCVRELGLKVVMLPNFIQRPLPAAGDVDRPPLWMDTYGPDSPHDYDPVWAKCVELGVSPTFHSGGFGWGSRASSHSYVYNHIGSFASAGDAICRSMFINGIVARFPELRCAFLEGGVAWGANLYSDILGHWEKRNADHIQHYNPANLDRERLRELFESYAPDSLNQRYDRIEYALQTLSNPDEPLDTVDEFERCRIERAEQIGEVFETNFYFGCEADDPSNAAAFDTRRNPHGIRLNAIFSSDIGHWDVPDMRHVLEEAHELVDRDLFSEQDFRDFVFANPVKLWTGSNPDFFAGTAVEDSVPKAL